MPEIQVEVIPDRRKKGLALHRQALIFLTITQKRNTPVYSTEVFQLELMTGFEPVTSSLPSNEVPSKAGDFGN